MNDFRKPAGFGNNKPDGQGGGGFGKPKKMFKATCSNCGKVAEVPFEPRGDRPVYCAECFAKSRAATTGQPGGFQKRDDRNKSQPRPFAQARPQGGDRRDTRVDDRADNRTNEIGRKLDQILAKLEELLTSQRQSRAPAPKIKASKKPSATKTKKKTSKK